MEILRKRSMYMERQLEGIKCVKISNISCFVEYKINTETKQCHLQIYTRLRPGNLEHTIDIDDLEEFDIETELKMMQLDILAPFNGSMTEEKYTQNAGSGRSAAKQNDTISESSYEPNSPVNS